MSAAEEPPAQTFEEVLARAERDRQRLGPMLPEIDPGDLHAILVAIHQPFGMGRHFLLRKLESGVNVF